MDIIGKKISKQKHPNSPPCHMGFPSCWAGWALPLPCPLPPGAPPPPGGPPPDGPAPPAGVLDCSWVVMAMVINILVFPVSEG